MNLAAMTAARDAADEYLGVALELVAECASESATPDQVARTHALVGSYLQLAGCELDRFEEAADARP